MSKKVLANFLGTHTLAIHQKISNRIEEAPVKITSVKWVIQDVNHVCWIKISETVSQAMLDLC